MALFPYTTKLVGQFRSVSSDRMFEYRHTTDPWAISQGLMYEVCVTDKPNQQAWRYATVKKTVAYIAVDEASDGKPVLEKWSIKCHTIFHGNNSN